MDSNKIGIEGENFVNDIAFRSFLKYWCYPNPKFENGNRKEICDLLIIFDNVCIIFSVKNYSFKGSHARYFNNTVEKAVKQLKGAEKTLLSSSEVHIKHPDRTVEVFPKGFINKIFKIIINLGEGLEFYDITRTTKENDFITIFDKDTFSTITNELDTIPDFIDYLEKRERLFKFKNVKVFNSEFQSELDDQDQQYIRKGLGNSIIIIGTEKDLLSYFFKNTRNFPEKLTNNDFTTYGDTVLEIAGSWEEFKLSHQAVSKEKADSLSYFVDHFIKNEVLSQNYAFKELLAKELLSLNRLKRRTIGNRFFEFYFKIKKYNERILHRSFLELGDLGIVFFNYFEDSDHQEIQKLFDLIFETFAYYYNYKHKTFVLIGINKAPNFVYSIYKDYERFTASDEKIIKHNIKELKWFTSYSQYSRNEDEFPETGF